jgi:hypothetical protein
MIKHIVWLCVALGFSITLNAQNGELRGVIYEKNTGKPIDYATVYLKENQMGAVSDDNGFYNISKIPPGVYTLFCSYLGYDSVKLKVTINAGKVSTQNLYLPKLDVSLQEFTISAEAIEKKENAQVSKTRITSQDMQKLVTFGGEPDLIQSLQILPGVYTTGDQGGQLFVRGGSPVMNKVLLDGMTIYQPFHSIGLFSVFDADIIRSADVYSAGFGAEYGGRISAIVDVTTREGAKNKFSGKIAANPFTSKILLEGPLKKYTEGEGSISYILSYKTSYLRQSSKVVYPFLEENRLPYNFNDLYGKLSFVGNNGSKLELFGYNFDDNVDFQGATKFNWLSNGFGAKFVVLPDAGKTKIDGFFAYTGFSMRQTEADNKPRFSDIKGVNIGLNFDYLMGKNQFVYGTEINTFRTNFEIYNINDRKIAQFDNNTELSAFARYKFVNRRWVLEPGMRMMYYATFSEFSFEPRFAAKYLATSKFRIKAASGLYSQNLMSAVSDRDVVNLFYGFLSSPSSLPKEFEGEPVTSRLQKAWHSVVGFEFDLSKRSEIMLEGYFKDFFQLTNVNRDKIFDDNELYLNKPDYQKKDYIVERGRAYGIDARYKFDNKTYYLWAVYSLTFVDRYDGIREYFPNFDRRHNINLVGSYVFGKQKDWDFNVRWNIGSGFPFTQTQGFYELINFSGGINYDYTKQNGDVGVIYSEINQGRLPYFHRLDISLQKSVSFGKDKTMKIIASVINAYNRANVFYFDRITYTRVNQLPILPSLGINYSF